MTVWYWHSERLSAWHQDLSLPKFMQIYETISIAP